LADGRWDEFVLPEGSLGHDIRDGRMTLAIRQRAAVQTM
jgi:hypothetical protein